MVVLDGGGMLTSGSNQYLQPDYLSPLPTTLDAKKSPLALLAQTCSQIGADSPTTKPLLPPMEKAAKKEHTSSSASAALSAERASAEKSEKHSSSHSPSDTTSSSSAKLAFKPYENIPSSRSERPTSKVSLDGNEGKKSPASGGSRTPATGRKSSSPSNNNNNSPKPASHEKSESPRAAGASPIIRSGLEILQGHSHSKDLAAYKNGMLGNPGLSSLSSLCAGCPPGLEAAAAAAASNPAFRSPFPGFAHSMLAAGYPPSALGMTPYMSYARVKTPAGGETLVPVCKDPYCTGCQFSMHNAQLLAAAAASQHCPSGCTQCDHHKYGLAAALSLMQQGAAPPGPPLASYSHQLGAAAAAAAAAAASSGRPYVCSWIAGENYCGKRFSTSDELLQHLRSHTAAAEAAGSLLSPSAAATHPLLSQRYPNPPLSPLSAARYHPYSKPGGLPPSLAASPFSAFNPTAMGPYYPYSFYGPRLGAAVHP
ncbi:hypothetical protein B566_EDAN004466 [Ephemera danica]|nr:hypothetical protein B566_EDAN004466 [Ephemera danica]